MNVVQSLAIIWTLMLVSLGAVDLSQLRDITGIERPSDQPSAAPWPFWPWLILGAATIFVVGFVSLRWRRGRRPPMPDPRAEALAKLDELEAQTVSGNGNMERLHTVLSDIVRRYLERRFQLPVLRQTTDELLRDMARSALLPKEQPSAVQELLRRCDLAKFAGMNSSAIDGPSSVWLARELIRSTPTAGSSAALSTCESV